MDIVVHKPTVNVHGHTLIKILILTRRIVPWRDVQSIILRHVYPDIFNAAKFGYYPSLTHVKHDNIHEPYTLWLWAHLNGNPNLRNLLIKSGFPEKVYSLVNTEISFHRFREKLRKTKKRKRGQA